MFNDKALTGDVSMVSVSLSTVEQCDITPPPNSGAIRYQDALILQHSGVVVNETTAQVGLVIKFEPTATPVVVIEFAQYWRMLKLYYALSTCSWLI